jgi:hypothetical protein
MLSTNKSTRLQETTIAGLRFGAQTTLDQQSFVDPNNELFLKLTLDHAGDGRNLSASDDRLGVVEVPAYDEADVAVDVTIGPTIPPLTMSVSVLVAHILRLRFQLT